MARTEGEDGSRAAFSLNPIFLLPACPQGVRFGAFLRYFRREKRFIIGAFCAFFWGFKGMRARDFQEYWEMKSYLSRICEAQRVGFEIEAFCRHLG